MVHTRSRYYRSPSPDYLEGADTTDFEPVVDTDEAIQPVSAWDTTRRLRVWSVGTFDDMEDDHRSMVRDRFSGRAGGISLPDWKLRFRTWMREKRQRSPSFNDWYAFELLPQHLEHEALQTYERWTVAHWLSLQEVERYWDARVELISALKEGAAMNLLPSNDGEEVEPTTSSEKGSVEDSKGKAKTLVKKVDSTKLLSRMAQATQAALAAMGPPPPFDPLRLFIQHLEVEYGGFRRDQMQRIQDFQREKDDTPRTMYTRLARFAVESGGVFAESQLVKIFLSKMDKRLLDLASPRIILDYDGKATLAQAFEVVEKCDKALCQHDATDMIFGMTEFPKSKKPVAVSGGLADTDPDIHCWRCGGTGHTKKDTSCPKYPKDSKSQGKAKKKEEGKPQKKEDGKTQKKQLKCNHCGRLNHDDDHCFQLHPELRPSSNLSEKEKALQAQIDKLQEQLKATKAVASSAQIVDSRAFSGAKASTSSSDYYLFGATGEMVAAAATRSQTAGKQPISPATTVTDGFRQRHDGPADMIGQARLPLSFTVADATTPVKSTVVPDLRNGNSPPDSLMQTLAHKVLQMPIFSGAELTAPGFQPAKVFNLAGKILEGKDNLPSVHVAQAVTEVSSIDDTEEALRLRARLASEAVAEFQERIAIPVTESTDPGAQFGNGAAYLADISARSARERQSLHPGVVRLVNDNGLFVVARTGNSSIRATPLRVLLDSGAQPVMIGKRLADDLGLTVADFEPCPFTILTSLGGTERATGITRNPLQLIFRVGNGPTYCHLSLRCAITGATNYDILVGQQALYPIGFGLDNWTEEAWIRPGFASGDGRKELIPVSFAAATMSMSAESIFGCSAPLALLPSGPELFQESFALASAFLEDQQDIPPLRAPPRHCKDPLLPWTNSEELSRQCRNIVATIAPKMLQDTSISSTFAQPIRWHPPLEGIILVELFAGIGTGLAAVLEVGLKVQRYIHVDNGFVSTRAARHHLQRLIAQYPEQLPPSAIHGCFGHLPRDVTLISDEDLKRLGHVDLVIAGWPCQGHSRAGAGQGLDDPRSSLFWDLVRVTQWWFNHQSTPPGYIFENVPPLGDSRSKIVTDGHYICQILGPPTFVDAAALGSYAHRPRWLWTNLVPHQVMSLALSRVPQPEGRKVDDILDDHHSSLPVVVDDACPFALVNKVGAPRGALPTLVSYPGSFAFRAHGPGMLWNTKVHTHEEPNADERERAMGFLTGTTAAHDLTEGQRRFVLGQAMDLNTLVWFLGVCLAVQRSECGHLLALKSEGNGQGAMTATNLTPDKEFGQLCYLKWQATEELQAQRVFAALAQDFGRLDAQEMFSRVFLKDISSFTDEKISQICGVGEAQGVNDLAPSEEARGTVVAPSFSD